jgi:hypothetical protein
MGVNSIFGKQFFQKKSDRKINALVRLLGKILYIFGGKQKS